MKLEEILPQTFHDVCTYSLHITAHGAEWTAYYQWSEDRWQNLTGHGYTIEEALKELRFMAEHCDRRTLWNAIQQMETEKHT